MPALAAVLAAAVVLAAAPAGEPASPFSDDVLERLEELQEDGVLSAAILSEPPSALLEELYAAALSQNLTNPKALERMRLNVEEGRTSAEQQVDTWSKAISKALDRAQKQRKERRRERREAREKLKEERRAAKAAERQEELRQESIAEPLAASGVRMPPKRPYRHSGREVLAAVRSGAAQALESLCADAESGADVEQPLADVDFIPPADDPDAEVGPPLHVAVAVNDVPMIAALLGSCGADADLIYPRTGYTALHQAVAQDKPDAVAALIERGANLDIRAREAGMSALHLAVTRAATFPGAGPAALRGGCTQLLLSAGAAIELEDHRKLYTPLHMAAGYGSPELAQLLLSFGASTTAEDESGQTPAQLAAHSNEQYPRRPDVLRLLEQEQREPALTGSFLAQHGLGSVARLFYDAGLEQLADVVKMEEVELAKRVPMKRKQRKRLEKLLGKRRRPPREL